jgi:hypothetical protein
MIPVPGNVRVWLAVGRTDMRRGMNGLALQVQETLKRDPHAGDLFVFRGRSGDLIKIIWHDATQSSMASPAKTSLRPINNLLSAVPVAVGMSGHGPAIPTPQYSEGPLFHRCTPTELEPCLRCLVNIGSVHQNLTIGWNCIGLGPAMACVV